MTNEDNKSSNAQKALTELGEKYAAILKKHNIKYLDDSINILLSFSTQLLARMFVHKEKQDFNRKIMSLTLSSEFKSALEKEIEIQKNIQHRKSKGRQQ